MKKLKQIIILAVASLSSIPMWCFWKTVVDSGQSYMDSYASIFSSLIWPIVFVCIFFALSALLGMLAKSYVYALLHSLFVALAFWLTFGFDTRFFVLGVFVGAITFLYTFRKDAESKLYLGFPVTKIVAGTLSLALFLFMIMSSLLYFHRTAVNKNSDDIFLPSAIENTVVNVVGNILQSRLGENVDLDQNVDALVMSMMQEQLQSQVENMEEVDNNIIEKSPEVALESLSQEQQEAFENYRSNLLSDVGISADINSEMTIRDMIREMINSIIQKYVGGYLDYVQYIFAVIFFFALEILSPIFYGVTICFGWIIFSVLKLTKFLSIKLESQEVERIEL